MLIIENPKNDECVCVCALVHMHAFHNVSISCNAIPRDRFVL